MIGVLGTLTLQQLIVQWRRMAMHVRTAPAHTAPANSLANTFPATVSPAPLHPSTLPLARYEVSLTKQHEN